ncbi:MAG TPA: serine hydrolase domain-containing protein [Gammaproteobacteria bacterium]|nr:serine hydrolase domain-containing protein [Luteimonas sp.]HRP35822.1 serine hydrolase domain-containing protein [Gammaproteobacteria bacterium]HRP73759.1 serine hydrolase domain-containing protein [Luteimonas sp.]
MIVERVLDARFAPLRDAFAAHFERDDEFRELGAGVVVYEAGHKVVDLHGGFQDARRQALWTERTLTNIWSASKGVMAVAIAQLVDAGALDYAAPVARWWPEFAQAGKQAITLDQVMSHRAGLNGFAAPTRPEDLYDWALMTRRIAEQAPLWPPGSTASYHGMTWGWITGELVRRVTGLMPRDYIEQHIAAPLQADLSLGVPPERMGDVAEIIPPEDDLHPASLNAIAVGPTVNPAPNAAAANHGAWRAAQIPAVNVHASADGLARLYGALANGGRLDAMRILSETALADMVRPRGEPRDEMLGERQWAAGVALNRGGLYGPDDHAFGHSGWGGSFGFADPATGRGVAYIVNRMGSALNGDPRARTIARLAAEL